MNVNAAKKQCSVAIVNSSRLFREGLKQLLLRSHLVVESEGATVADLVGGTTGEQADLVICSLNLDERASTELSAVQDIRAVFPHAKLIILTDVVSASGVREAVRAGVDGILSAEISDEVLQRSLELILLGQTLFPVRFLHAPDEAAPANHYQAEPSQPLEDRFGTSQALFQRPPDMALDRVAGPQLSEREGQILQCLVLGSSNKGIARKFNISEATVKVHIRALLRKIRVSNRTQAAIWALSNRPVAEKANGRSTPSLLPVHA
jgi:two-component system nitrate/nitrite response regulator NarL